MHAPIAPVAGPQTPCCTPGLRASLALALLSLLLLPAAPAQTTAAPVVIDASDCCNLSSQAIDPLGPDGAWWTDPAYIRAAHLTADLQQRLTALYAQHTTAIQAYQIEYAEQKAALKTLLASPTAREDDVDTQIARIEQARTAAAKEVILTKLAIRAQLTAAQWQQVLKLQRRLAK